MSCGHKHLNDARSRKTDPTGTTGIRKKFEAEIVRRIRRLRGLITESLVANDAFGIRKPKLFGDADPIRARAFEFSRSGDKVAGFMGWLREQQDEGVLGVMKGTSIESSAQNSWMNVYIENSYQKGIRDSGAKLRAAGAKVASSWVEDAMTRPIHADRVGLAYTRSFTQLKGITEAMDQQISSILASGLAQGKNPAVIAREINKKVDKIGVVRARALARTEVISAHAEATVNSFQEAGIEGVELQSEFSTAGDGLVCPECDALEGEVFTLEGARGIIPVHPNCRCAWIPVVVGGTGIELI